MSAEEAVQIINLTIAAPRGLTLEEIVAALESLRKSAPQSPEGRRALKQDVRSQLQGLATDNADIMIISTPVGFTKAVTLTDFIPEMGDAIYSATARSEEMRDPSMERRVLLLHSRFE